MEHGLDVGSGNGKKGGFWFWECLHGAVNKGVEEHMVIPGSTLKISWGAGEAWP